MEKNFKDTKVGQFLGKIAPAALGAIGTAFPPVKVLTDILGGLKEEGLSPVQEIEYQKLIKEYELNELKEYLADVQNARAMQIEALKQDDKFSKRFVYYLAAFSIGLGFAYIFFITFCDIPQANQRFADTILGVVISIIFGTIFSFFFGSSKGSSDKTRLLIEKNQ